LTANEDLTFGSIACRLIGRSCQHPRSAPRSGIAGEEPGISFGETSRHEWMGGRLAKLTFCEAMMATRCVEHQIEAAAIDTLACHLHTEYRMLEQLFK